MASQLEREQFMGHFLEEQAKIYAFVHTLVPNSADAEELFQQVALTLWERWESFDPSISSSERPFLAWATGIARNHVRNFTRQQARRGRHVQLMGADLIDRIADGWHELDRSWQQRQDALRNCMNKLSANDRRDLEGFYSGQSTSQSLAEQSGVSVRTVYRKIQWLRKVLLDCISATLAAQGEMQ